MPEHENSNDFYLTLGKRWRVPTSAAIPISTSLTWNHASLEQYLKKVFTRLTSLIIVPKTCFRWNYYRISAAVMRSTPAPTHALCTAEITGFTQTSNDDILSWYNLIALVKYLTFLAISSNSATSWPIDIMSCKSIPGIYYKI